MIKVSKDINNRLDRYLVDQTDLTRSQIKKLIDEGQILVNNEQIKAGYRPVAGDTITITEKEEIRPDPEEMDLDILYEDKEILVLNKPKGLLIHPTDHQTSGTLVNGLLHYTDHLGNKDSIRPGIVHRLDKDTSGVLIVAKTDRSYENLVEMFKAGNIKRYYTALLDGHLKDAVYVDQPIARDPNIRVQMAVVEGGRDSQSHFVPVKYIKDFTLADIEIFTGRTHQIRVHSLYLGRPVVGDPVYGRPNSYGINTPMLHCKRLVFDHPITDEELDISADLPDRFLNIIKRIQAT